MTTKTQELEVTEEVADENDGTISPIELAKLAGVRPQMVYQYIGKGNIAAERNSNGKLRVQESVATEWVASYLERKAEREASKLAKQEAELAGAEA